MRTLRAAVLLSFALTLSLPMLGQQTSSSGLQFVPVPACRIVDTRGPNGPYGGPELSGGTDRRFDLSQGGCNIPTTALAYSINVTVVPDGPLNFLTVYNTYDLSVPVPDFSTLNSDGRVKANAAIVASGNGQNPYGDITVYASDPTQVILDINGYFVPAGTSSAALSFNPLPIPCRLVDTRNPAGPLGGPFIQAGSSRDFPIQSGNCFLPSDAQAYSLNVTAIPHTTLNYLTVWPTGEALPGVSTLNSPTGTVTANAAIAAAGTGGSVSVFASDDTDVILDVNGYFAAPAEGGLSFYPAPACRALDTRSSSGPFYGFNQFDLTAPNTCGLPYMGAYANAEYLFNATAIPEGPLNYLLLVDQGPPPNASTLNANDGAITSNMAITPIFHGVISAETVGTTNLILDYSGYFAP